MNKNQKLLQSFVKFADKHPELRFWQSLLNWSKVDHIFATRNYDIGDGKGELLDNLEDTYNWTGKNK